MDAREPVVSARAMRVSPEECAWRDEAIANEVPVVVRVGAESFAVTCSPCDLEDLAFGIAFSLGFVERADDIAAVEVRPCADGFAIDVSLASCDTRKNSGAPVSAGSVDAASMPELPGADVAPLGDHPQVAASAIRAASRALFGLQTMHQETGATHAAMFVDLDGRPRVVREDIGRHIAIDKVIGAMLREGLDPHDGFMFLSSRCALDLAIRCARFGIALVATVSAPTSATIAFADRANMTLAAFARDTRFTLYSHPDRVVL